MRHLSQGQTVFPGTTAAESTFSLELAGKKRSFWFMEEVVFLKFPLTRSYLDPAAAQWDGCLCQQGEEKMSLCKKQLQGNLSLRPPQPQGPGAVGALQQHPRRGHPAAFLPPAQTSAGSLGNNPSLPAWLPFFPRFHWFILLSKRKKKKGKRKISSVTLHLLWNFWSTPVLRAKRHGLEQMRQTFPWVFPSPWQPRQAITPAS